VRLGIKNHVLLFLQPFSETARCKALVCDRSLAGIAGSNTTVGMDVCLASVVRCQVELSASG
jgi:hypothetical protein